MTSALAMYLGIPGAVVAMLAIYEGVRGRYRKTWGRRRQLRSALLKLGCGLTIEYVDQLLGQPITKWQTAEASYYAYRSPDSWVVVVESDGSGRVDAFVITVRGAKLRIRTDTFTNDQLKVVLGRSQFTDLSVDGAARLDVGARRFAYTEAFYFGNPGRYDHYILSYNDAGFGEMPDVSGRHGYVDESLLLPDERRSEYLPSLPVDEALRLREGFIVNTFATVSGGQGLDNSIAFNGVSVGVDLDQVRRLPG